MMPEAPFQEYVPDPPEPAGYCIGARVQWFSPFRAGGWRKWWLSLDKAYWREAPTAWVDLCILGLSIHLEIGWSRPFNGS
jgi:hypothetical protein